MNKIKNIIEGFSGDLPTEEDWYKKRISLCNSCEFNSANGAPLSVACAGIKKLACPSADKGSCNQCCCCVEQKCKVKSEACPKGKWTALTAKGGDFEVELVSPGKLTKSNGGFIVDVGMINGNNLPIILRTKSLKTNLFYDRVDVGCGCTTTSPKEIQRGREYEHKVNISLSSFGEQRKTMDIHFTTSNRVSKVVNLVFKYNRINVSI